MNQGHVREVMTHTVSVCAISLFTAKRSQKPTFAYFSWDGRYWSLNDNYIWRTSTASFFNDFSRESRHLAQFNWKLEGEYHKYKVKPLRGRTIKSFNCHFNQAGSVTSSVYHLWNPFAKERTTTKTSDMLPIYLWFAEMSKSERFTQHILQILVLSCWLIHPSTFWRIE